MDGISAYATSTKLLCLYLKLSDSLLSSIFCSKTVHRPNDFRPRGGKPMPELMRNFTCDRPLNCVAIRPWLLGCTPKLAPADSTDVNDLLCLTLTNVMQCHPVLQHKVGNGNFVHGCPGQTSCCSFNHSDLQIGFQADLPASCYTGDSSHFFLDASVTICWPPQPFAARMLKVVVACSLRVVGKMPATWPWLVCLGQHWISKLTSLEVLGCIGSDISGVCHIL